MDFKHSIGSFKVLNTNNSAQLCPFLVHFNTNIGWEKIRRLFHNEFNPVPYLCVIHGNCCRLFSFIEL